MKVLCENFFFLYQSFPILVKKMHIQLVELLKIHFIAAVGPRCVCDRESGINMFK